MNVIACIIMIWITRYSMCSKFVIKTTIEISDSNYKNDKLDDVNISWHFLQIWDTTHISKEIIVQWNLYQASKFDLELWWRRNMTYECFCWYTNVVISCMSINLLCVFELLLFSEWRIIWLDVWMLSFKYLIRLVFVLEINNIEDITIFMLVTRTRQLEEKEFCQDKNILNIYSFVHIQTVWCLLYSFGYFVNYYISCNAM